MQMVSIVTFTHQQEKFNENFITLCERVKETGYIVDPMIFCDQKITVKDPYRCFELKGSTKYIRILFSIRNSKSNLLIFVDNDITPDYESVILFIDKCIKSECAVGWGKIDSLKLPGLVPGMIRVDKRISHDFIRPFLWKTHLGITVPGQVFCLNRKIMSSCLQLNDTVFDDLSIGTAIKRNNLKIYSSNLILGYERPNTTLSGLIKQRKRWAKGFSQILFSNMHSPVYPYVLIHGVAYHFLWLPIWIIVLSLLYLYPLTGCLFLLFSILWMSRFSISEFVYAIMYIFVFPYIHCVWMRNFAYEIRQIHSQHKNPNNNI